MNEHEQPIMDRETWRKYISDWKKQDISASHYCRENGLNIHRFKYWQYQLAPDTKKRTKKIPSVLPPFVPVQIESPMKEKHSLPWVITIGSKSRIEVTAIDEGLLQKLIHYLAEV